MEEQLLPKITENLINPLVTQFSKDISYLKAIMEKMSNEQEFMHMYLNQTKETFGPAFPFVQNAAAWTYELLFLAGKQEQKILPIVSQLTCIGFSDAAIHEDNHHHSNYALTIKHNMEKENPVLHKFITTTGIKIHQAGKAARNERVELGYDQQQITNLIFSGACLIYGLLRREAETQALEKMIHS